MRYVFVLVLLFFFFDGFYLIPPLGGRDALQYRDLATLVTVAASFLAVVFKPSVLKTNKEITGFVVFLLFLIVLQPFLASLQFGQSVLNGFIAIRVMALFLLYFLLLSLFRDLQQFVRLIRYVNWMMVAVAIASLYQYFVGGLFQTVYVIDMFRSDVPRADVPGFRLMSFLLVWNLTIFFAAGASRRARAGFMAGLFMVVHILRQTRSLLIAAAGVIVVCLFRSRMTAWMMVAAIGCIGALGLWWAGDDVAVGLAVNPFSSAAEEVYEGTGTWGSRLQQAKFAWDVFLEYPLLGSGGSAIRMLPDEARTTYQGMLANIAYTADLGYLSFLKTFGLVGMIWLLWIFYYVYSYVRRNTKSNREIYVKDTDFILSFLFSFLVFLMISSVTIPWFLQSDGIVVISIFLAMFSLHSAQSKEVEIPKPSKDEIPAWTAGSRAPTEVNQPLSNKGNKPVPPLGIVRDQKTTR